MSYNYLRKGRYSQANQDYFITIVTHKRRHLLSDFYTARIVINEMMRLEKEQHMHWLTWIVMPNHIHGLIQLTSTELSNAIRLLKGRSAYAINKHLSSTGSVWQANYYDHALRAE